MNKLLFLILILLFSSCAEAQLKVQDLTEDISPSGSADVAYSVKNYATSPTPRKVKWANITKISGWVDDGTVVRLNTSTDNVAIGTTAASTKLTVLGTVTATAFAGDGSALTGISGGGGGGGAGTVNSGSANKLAYYATTGTTVSDQSVIYTDGTNIGIGTSLPVYLLDVYGIARFAGSGGVTLNTGGAIRTSTTTSNTALLQAYDTDGVAYTTFGTLTAGTTPTFDLNSSTTVGSDTIVSRTGTQTLTNKTLTLPVISSVSNTGTVTLPTGPDTIVARTSTDTMTNKTLTSPKIGTSILGVGGTTLVGISTVTSAVNYITIANSATGNDPSVTVTGDANRGLILTNAGTGGLSVVSTGTGPSYLSRGLTINNDSNSGTGNDLLVKTTTDTNALRVVSSTNNVGIGSNTPGAKLDVNGTVRASAFVSSGAGASYTTGNLGVGTTVPPNALYVVGTPMFTGGLNLGIGTTSLTRLCIANNAIATCP